MANGSGGSLLKFITQAADIPLVGTFAVPLLNLLGYDGQKVWTNLQVLDSLQAMGGTQGAAKVLKVFVDQASLLYLDGVEVDYVETLEGAGFKFNNPQVKSTCGCGSSFSA